MLFNCNDFKIFGDGGNRLVLVATTPAGQEAFIINNPFLESLEMQCEAVEVFAVDGFRECIQGLKRSKLTMCAGEIEVVSGDRLDQIYNPVMQKTVTELISVIENKLGAR